MIREAGGMEESQIWTRIFILVLLAALATPAVLLLNRGRFMRNALIWGAIVFGLWLVYQLFGPFETGGRSAHIRAEREKSVKEVTIDHDDPIRQ